MLVTFISKSQYRIRSALGSFVGSLDCDFQSNTEAKNRGRFTHLPCKECVPYIKLFSNNPCGLLMGSGGSWKKTSFWNGKGVVLSSSFCLGQKRGEMERTSHLWNLCKGPLRKKMKMIHSGPCLTTLIIDFEECNELNHCEIHFFSFNQHSCWRINWVLDRNVHLATMLYAT